MDNEEMEREIAKSAQAFAEPIDFDKLIKDGLLKANHFMPLT
jgi:hypothetical protein